MRHILIVIVLGILLTGLQGCTEGSDENEANLLTCGEALAATSGTGQGLVAAERASSCEAYCQNLVLCTEATVPSEEDCRAKCNAPSELMRAEALCLISSCSTCPEGSLDFPCREVVDPLAIHLDYQTRCSQRMQECGADSIAIAVACAAEQPQALFKLLNEDGIAKALACLDSDCAEIIGCLETLVGEPPF